MGVFLLTPINNAERLGKAISTRFGKDSYAVPQTHSWLVAFDGTTKELSDELGITDGSGGTGIVVPVVNYYGRAPTDLWEWVKNRMERT